MAWLRKKWNHYRTYVDLSTMVPRDIQISAISLEILRLLDIDMSLKTNRYEIIATFTGHLGGLRHVKPPYNGTTPVISVHDKWRDISLFGHWARGSFYSWWRHDTETISALLSICEGNPPVTDGFPLLRAGNADMELWKSSCDDMHWQQGKCYIYSWRFWPCFNSCRYYDFISNSCYINMDLTLPFTWLVCGTSHQGLLWQWASSTGLTAVSKFKPRLPAQWAVGTHRNGPSRIEKVTSRMNRPIRNSTQIRNWI